MFVVLERLLQLQNDLFLQSISHEFFLYHIHLFVIYMYEANFYNMILIYWYFILSSCFFYN